MNVMIDTPCIGVCSTVYGDDICRGCKRQVDEVIQWNTYSSSQKQDVFNRLDNLVSSCTKKYLYIHDEELFAQALRTYNIRQWPGYTQYTFAYYLLRTVIDKKNSILDLGLTITNKYSKKNLHELFRQLDNEILDKANKDQNQTVEQ